MHATSLLRAQADTSKFCEGSERSEEIQTITKCIGKKV